MNTRANVLDVRLLTGLTKEAFQQEDAFGLLGVVGEVLERQHAVGGLLADRKAQKKTEPRFTAGFDVFKKWAILDLNQ